MKPYLFKSIDFQVHTKYHDQRKWLGASATLLAYCWEFSIQESNSEVHSKFIWTQSLRMLLATRTGPTHISGHSTSTVLPFEAQSNKLLRQHHRIHVKPLSIGHCALLDSPVYCSAMAQSQSWCLHCMQEESNIRRFFYLHGEATRQVSEAGDKTCARANGKHNFISIATCLHSGH